MKQIFISFSPLIIFVVACVSMWPIWWPVLPAILFGIIFNVLMQTNPLAFRSDQYAVQALVYIAVSAAPVALLTFIALRLRNRPLKNYAERIAEEFPFAQIRIYERPDFEKAIKNMNFYKEELTKAVDRGDLETATQYREKMENLDGKWK